MKMRPALVAVALLAGCGGGDDATSGKDADGADTATATATATQDASSGDTMSAEEWSRRVEAVCARSATKAARAGKELRRKSAAAGDSEQELTYKTLALTSDLLDPWLDRIEALPKPEGHEQAATTFVGTMREVGDLLDKTATAIKEDDQANGETLVDQLKAKTAGVRDQARALDIEECNPPSA